MAHIQDLLADAIPLLKLQTRDRILELGCGDGWACRMLADRVPDGLVIGLESSDDYVREARAKSTAYENLLFIWSAAEQIPWQADFFTCVLSIDLVYESHDPGKLLHEAFRVLAPGGMLWIVIQSRAVSDVGSNRALATTPGAWADHRSLIQLLRAAGFQEIVSHPTLALAAQPPTKSEKLPLPEETLVLSARKPQK